jgi:signal transduction histidine kinase
MSHYIAACGVAFTVRIGRFPLAVVATATLGASLVVTMYRRSEGWEPTMVVASMVFYLIVWALGLGTRSAGRAEAARVEARHRLRQLEVATDLHDLVAHNLAGFVMAAEALPQDNPAVVELAERARRANASLRAITSVLREEGETEERIPAVGAEEALARGLETVGSRGGQPQVAPGTKTALVGLPKAVDHAVGRILSEALCNVAKYADLEEPVVVAAERTGDRLDLMVSNGIDPRRTPSPDGMGLLVVRQHAEVVGGRADSSAQGKVWVCTASLPLGHTGAAR